MFEKIKMIQWAISSQIFYILCRENIMQKQYKNSSYIIYDDGRCYSLLSNKFLTPKMSVRYPSYNLTLGGKKKQIKIHRMVAETFLNNPENKPIVNHIDGDTHNYKLNNLKWVNAKENSKHAMNIGLFTSGDQTLNKFNGNLEGENWMGVKSYPNYIISSFGRIMNISTKRLLKTYIDNSGGYLCVRLWKNNTSKLFRIHELVYMNFNNDFNTEDYVINHIDGNKLNNKIDNLEKVTYAENNYHAAYIIKTNKCCKEVFQLSEKGEIINTFPSVAEAARKTGITNISRACKKYGRAGGYYWKYKEEVQRLVE